MTRYIADTHALIWWWDDDARLSDRARAALSDRANPIRIPSVCAWEIANKIRTGKLPEMAPYIADYDSLVSADGFAHLDLRHDHAVRAGLLPGDHRDPFDRLIAAQAMIEDMTVITRDAEFATFGCKVLW